MPSDDTFGKEYYKLLADMSKRIAAELMVAAAEFDNPKTASQHGISQPDTTLDMIRAVLRQFEFRDAIANQIKSGRGLEVYSSLFAPKDKCAFVPLLDNGDYVILCHADIKAEVQQSVANLVKELTSEVT